MLDRARVHGHDTSFGGFYHAAPAVRPFEIEGQYTVVQRKLWWVQFEALHAFAAASRWNPAHFARMQSLWQYIRTHLIDPRHGGVYVQGTDRLRRLQQWRARIDPRHPSRIKGDPWKDGSHEGRALLAAIAAARPRAAEPERTFAAATA